MSYKALYRKYRPNGFADVMGQDHIISTLKNIIESKKISHAYLFTGPRGTGKTSVAHVFAREINKKAGGNIESNSLDIIEIDAASNNGVAEIRKIIENAQFSPTNSKYKVYIVDEVHMLTKGAFNALLKTLEEPPEHLVFILATTEPHKIPVTILSRTQRFNFKRIDENIIKTLLNEVLTKENISFDDEAIKFIAKLAQGGLRDALSIADQAASYGGGSITFATISQVFGVISIANQIKIINLAYSKKVKEMLMLTNQFIDNGADIERLTSSLIDVIRDFIIYQKTSSIELCDTLVIDDINQLVISVEFAYKMSELLIQTLNELKFSQIPKQLFELSLLKIIGDNTKQDKQEIVLENNAELNTEDIILKTQAIKTEEETANIFETQKTTIDEVNIEIDKVNEITQEIELQENINNEIISTQDIPLDEFNENEGPTEELDLSSYFSVEEESLSKDNATNKNIDDLINLLQQSDRQIIEKFKNIIEHIDEHLPRVSDKTYISLLRNTKIIAASSKFILFSSDKDDTITSINNEANTQEFIDSLHEIFGEALYVVAITREQFEILKKQWGEMARNNALPPIKEIPSVEATEKEKTEEEKFGKDLFGELFK